MKIKFTLWVAALMVSATLLSSCNDTTGKWQTSKTGLQYKIVDKSGKGDTPKIDDWMTIVMKYRALELNDSLLFDSKNISRPMELPMMKSVHQADIYEGLGMMRVGDSAIFKCDADSVFLKLFKRPVPEELKDIKTIVFEIKMLDIQTKAEREQKLLEEQKKVEEQLKKDKMEEKEKLEKYLKDNNITVEPTADSLFVVITEEGNGPKPQAGDKVKVHYTGYLLDGTKFDSSVDRGQPFEFVLGQHQVITAWDEGIAMLKKGTKAKLVFPSKLGYGSRGAGGVIPPFAPLVFDVELIDFTSSK
jgi:FKBP-type peptidyl-prolyl cis-trans isomerase